MSERFRVFAIDPGCRESAYVDFSTDIDVHPFDGEPDRKLHTFGKCPNGDLLELCESIDAVAECAIEMISGYGMSVGQEVFETCVWVGRFQERMGGSDVRLVTRGEIKLWHTDSRRATDSQISNALKAKYGEVGTKAAPGFCYGMKADIWQAFALATYLAEKAADDWRVSHR